MIHTVESNIYTPKYLRDAGYSVKKLNKKIESNSSEIYSVLKNASMVIFEAADTRMTPTGKFTMDVKLTEALNALNQFLYKYVEGTSRYRLLECTGSAVHGDVTLKVITFDDNAMKATFYTIELTVGNGFVSDYFNCKRNRDSSFIEILKRFFSL